jgi:hypothetical protein
MQSVYKNNLCSFLTNVNNLLRDVFILQVEIVRV